MKKLKIFRSGLCLFLLAVVFVFSVSTMAYAANEIINIDSNGVRTDGTPIKWTQDVTIQWEANMSTGHVLQGFVYRWNNSSTPLTDLTEANAEGTVSNSINPPYVTKPALFFANDDSNVMHYLHVRTWYNSGSAVAYSDDVVIGPINIDNVAPAGTVRITDSAGSDIESTYNTNLNLRLSASRAPVKVYVNETANRDTATSSTYASAVTYTLNNTEFGEKRIYVWFEDAAGNVSSAAVTDTVTLLSSVSISPYDGTFDIALEEKDFIVDGTDATYNWTITTLSGEDVADFVGDPNGTNGVTVSFHNPGTFKLTATPTEGGTDISSGTITVIESTLSKMFSLITTSTTNTNTIGFIFEGTGITTAHELGTAIGDVDLVARWDATTQSYSSHPMAVETINNFTLNVGEAYFVSVKSAHDFTLTGTPPSSKTVNLITTSTTNTNAIGIPKSKENLITAHSLGLDIGDVDLVARWDAPTQSYSSHPMAVETINNFAIEWGQGYFISVKNNKAWVW